MAVRKQLLHHVQALGLNNECFELCRKSVISVSGQISE